MILLSLHDFYKQIVKFVIAMIVLITLVDFTWQNVSERGFFWPSKRFMKKKSNFFFEKVVDIILDLYFFYRVFFFVLIKLLGFYNLFKIRLKDSIH